MTTPASQAAVQATARVTEVRHYGRVTQVWLACPTVAARALPGQFVMLAVPLPGFHLRRPVSVHRVVGDRLSLLIEVRGEGTRAIADVEVGDTLTVGGPVGTPFPLALGTHALLVGGGVGCAPLQFLCDALVAEGSAAAAVFGFRDAHHARMLQAFDLPELSVSTEDGSLGVHGTVLEALAHAPVRSDTVLYTCGPLPMLAALQPWAAARQLTAFASLEAHMACGTGVCHGCVVSTTDGYARVCAEGPVLPLSELVFT